MKEAIYFQHDMNAQDDPKIIKLRMSYWWEGYWLFWALLEYMRWESDVLLKQCDCNAFAFRSQCDINKFTEFLSFCVDIWLFVFDDNDKIYYSERLQANVEWMREKSAKASKSANERWKKRNKENANALHSECDGNAIKEKKRKEKKTNVTEKNSVPPRGKISSKQEIEINQSNGESPAQQESIDNLFQDFWDLYDKKIDRDKAYKKFCKLSKKDIAAIMIHIPKYKISQPIKKYRKDPCTYLNNNSRENEVVMWWIDYTNIQNFHDMMMQDKVPELKQSLWLDVYFATKKLRKQSSLYLSF